MKNVAIIFALALSLDLGSPAAAIAVDHFKMLDLKIGDQRLTGRIMTHNDQSCWLLRRDGSLRQVATAQVSEFKELNERFQAHSMAEMKSQLQSEFGKSFEVRATGHYVVTAPKGRAETYAAIFDRIYREFARSFRARGLELTAPEFPLVAVVFPDQLAFLNFCKAEKIAVQAGLVGYYLPSSNRVVMYERPNNIEVDSTVIHEATHQVAFNTGIHSRLADHPKWVVEGLATVFEADGVRSRAGTSSPADRVNRERFLWFQDYAKGRRVEHSLAKFLGDNQSFDTSTLDAYSEAWAITFFLVETRPVDYSRYLKRLSARDPLRPYDAKSRLQDFTEAFGSDLNMIESSMLRFIKRTASR